MLLTNDSGLFTDLWAFGCIIYEMAVGVSPFHAKNSSAIFDNILHRRLSFPTDIDVDLKNLISDLLTSDSNERSKKCTFGFMKSHQFFKGCPWSELKNQTINYTIPQEDQKTKHYIKNNAAILPEGAIND